MVLESYTKKGNHLKNQDALLTYTDENKVICAVADGHGFYMHFRSGYGSQIAVECAIDVYKDVMEADINTLIKKENELTSEWKKRVLAHYKEKPISSFEWFTAKEFAQYYQTGQLPIPYMYGSTLLISIYFTKENRLFIARVGDGEIFKVNENNEILDLVEKEDFGSEYVTESLCEDPPHVKDNLESISFVEGLKEDDTLIVASDGLSKFSNMDDIVLYMKNHPENLEELIEKLNNVDDFTVIVFKR